MAEGNGDGDGDGDGGGDGDGDGGGGGDDARTHTRMHAPNSTRWNELAISYVQYLKSVE